MAKQKFRQRYTNQTELGRHFGLSAIAIGKKMQDLGLRDGKVPTPQALSSGVAIIAMPLRDGTPYFMWDKHKVTALLESIPIKKISEFEKHCRDVVKIYNHAVSLDDQGEDKMASLMYQIMMNDVPEILQDRVRKEFLNFRCTSSKNAANSTDNLDAWLSAAVAPPLVIEVNQSVDGVFKLLAETCHGHFYLSYDDEPKALPIYEIYFDDLKDVVMFKLRYG